ncbi:MAG TPA: hypothetical protein VJQ84_01110 [Solirubrobacterales bacterium]|nr:hypothetical protein [Solirubrobacterales bacterium]
MTFFVKPKVRLAAAAALAAFAMAGSGVVLAANSTSATHRESPEVSSQHQAADVSADTSKNTDTGKSSAFGQQVKEQVQDCQAARTASDRGIGDCVSAWVTANNPGQSSSHGAPTNTTGAKHSGR